MSVYVVPHAHIDALLNGALTVDRHQRPAGTFRWSIPEPEHVLTVETANDIGAMLLAENQRSVNLRHGMRDVAPPYSFVPDPRPVDPVRLLRVTNCYIYQSCWPLGWDRSDARRFCDALKELAISCLPGYDDGPWVIEHLEEMYAE